MMATTGSRGRLRALYRSSEVSPEVVVLFNCELLDSDLRAVLLTRLGQLLNAAVKDRANSF